MGNIDQYFLMGSPIKVVSIAATYLIFVLYLGPAYMKNRPPMKLTAILAVYNAFQVLYSLYMTVVGFSFIFKHGIVGERCLTANEEIRNEIQLMGYIYFTAKLSEFLDTVFFVLRKKDNQVTFLHLYHHTLMFLVTWVCINYDVTESTVFIGSLNSFVHVIMYAYYGLSAIPWMTKYLWWKKYITSLQLVQFVMILIQVIVYHNISSCQPTKILLYMIYANGLLFIYLFGRFYVNSYTKKSKTNKSD